MEEFFRSQVLSRLFLAVTILGFTNVQINKLHLAASFQAPRLLRFIRKEVLKGRYQKRAEFASLLIYARQCFVLKKIKEKALGQVLCVMRRKPIAPDMAVKGVPIELTKLGQRVFRA